MQSKQDTSPKISSFKVFTKDKSTAARNFNSIRNISVAQFSCGQENQSKQKQQTILRRNQSIDQRLNQSADLNQKDCVFCSETLKKITDLKKRQILLQFQNQKLKQKIQKLDAQCKILISKKKDSIQMLIKGKIDCGQHQAQDFYQRAIYCKEDLQAQLFEAKFMNELLQLNKLQKKQKVVSNIVFNIAKEIEVSSDVFVRKYQKILFQNHHLQQRIMVQDKIIQEKQLFPLYHYDQRITLLRKNVQFWFGQTMNCKRVFRTQIDNLKQCNLFLVQQIQKLKKNVSQFQQKIRALLNNSQQFKKQFAFEEIICVAQQAQINQKLPNVRNKQNSKKIERLLEKPAKQSKLISKRQIKQKQLKSLNKQQSKKKQENKSKKLIN